MKGRSVVLCVMTLCGSVAAALWATAGPGGVVSYPEGYRNWVHVKSMLVGPQSPSFARFGGLHHIYANEKALQGFASGAFSDGSVLVFDLFDTQESKGATIEGARKFIDVMEKDSKRFASTGGWGFEEFKGGNKADRALTKEAAQKCSACHMTANSDSVFSKFRP